MRVLLDTHAFLWMHTEPDRLGRQRELVTDTAIELLLSAASSWEIAVKYALGRLPLPSAPEQWVPARLEAAAVVAVPVEHSHALAVASLPPVHRDPFDRLLVAVSRSLAAPLLSADPVFTGYEVELLVP